MHAFGFFVPAQKSVSQICLQGLRHYNSYTWHITTLASTLATLSSQNLQGISSGVKVWHHKKKYSVHMPLIRLWKLLTFFSSALHTYTKTLQRPVFYIQPQLHLEMVKLTGTHLPSNNPGLNWKKPWFTFRNEILF